MYMYSPQNQQQDYKLNKVTYRHRKVERMSSQGSQRSEFTKGNILIFILFVLFICYVMLMCRDGEKWEFEGYT